MKVLVNGLSITRRGAGISRYASGLIRTLVHQPSVAKHLTVAMQASVQDIAAGAQRLLVFPDRVRNLSRISCEQIHLLPRVREHDLTHYLDFAPPALAPGRAVVTIHDMAVFRFPECYTAGQRTWKQLMTRHAARHARHLIAISEFTKCELIELLGVHPDRITVIPNGFDPSPWQALAGPARETPARPYFLYVGTLAPQKNLVRLVRALDIARRRYDLPHQLILVGKAGWGVEPLHDEILRLGLEKDVRLAGFVPDNEMAQLYRNATAVTYVSLYEGFGYPPLEAMAVGVPVITSQAASLPEVVGDAGLQVDPYDEEELAMAMSRVAESDKLRSDLVQRGRERIPRFTWDRCANDTFETYLRLTGEQ